MVYRIDGGTWVLYTGKLNVTGEKGTHTIDFYATDVAGNAEQAQSITVKIGGKSGTSGLLTNPILWIVIISAALAVLVLLVFMMKRRKGQQPVMYAGQYQQAPQQADFPPPGSPPMG